MSNLLSLHPYLAATLGVFGPLVVAFAVAAVILLAGERLGRAGTPSVPAYACAGVCFVGAVLASEFLRLSDDQTTGVVALLGGMGLLALVAGFNAAHRDRADEFGMHLVGGSVFKKSFEKETGGVLARFKPWQGIGRRDDVPLGILTRIPNDALEIEAEVPALDRVFITARWSAWPAFLPRFLTEQRSGLFGRSTPALPDLNSCEGPASWGKDWLFRESSPGAAARIFGRALPPLFGEGGFYLNSVEVRGGRLLCQYETRRVGREDVPAAEEAVRDFAKKLTGADSPA